MGSVLLLEPSAWQPSRWASVVCPGRAQPWSQDVGLGLQAWSVLLALPRCWEAFRTSGPLRQG